MASTSFQVDSYTYYSWSSRMTGKTNLILSGAGKKCSVWFVEDPNAELPAASMPSSTYIMMWYHHWQFPHLLDMLRNEGPVSVFFDDDNGWANSRISTSDEPVGDGELHD